MDPIDGAIAVIMIMSVGGGLWMMGTITKALVSKWQRPRAIGDNEAAELREAIGHLANEVGELHERLDFAERMISARRSNGELGGGS